MPTVQSAKFLRVALINGASITDDRVFKKPAPVSIGQSTADTFIVPPDEKHRSGTILTPKQGKYFLSLLPGMSGKVLLNQQEQTLEQLRAANEGTPLIPLDEHARGRLTVGSVSLLFQFVSPRLHAAPVQLPKELRGGPLDQVDRAFLIFLAISLLLHFGGAFYIALRDPPPEEEVALEQLPDRFLKVMLPPQQPQPKEEKVAKTAPTSEEGSKKEVAKKAAAKTTTTAAPQKEAMVAKVAAAGLLKVIGASGAGGALADVLSNSKGAGDVASALAGASGVGLATDALAGETKGAASGKAASIGDLGTSGGGKVALGEKGAADVRGGVSLQAPEIESADVDRGALTNYVKGRKTAIQACYERELKRNPTLRGKVLVRFSINSRGRVGDIEIEENTLGNDAVAACITSVIRSWVFPFRPESDVPVAYPFVFAPAN